MSRFLFVVPPLTGHVNPTVGVGAELASRGHHIAWVGHPGRVRPLIGEDARLFELDDAIPGPLLAEMTARANRVRGLESLKFLWEDFLVPLCRAMVPGVEAAVDSFGPDALVVDQQTVAGALVARRRGLPWATSATTSAGVTRPLDGLPKVQQWLDEQLAALTAEAGLPPTVDVDRSPHRVLIFSTAALAGDGPWPEHYRFVGPALGSRPRSVDFPWEALDSRPKVLVSLGTVNAERGERFYRAVTEALAGESVQVVLVAPEALTPPLPESFIRRDYVPQLELLPKMDAVVTHGGHNTVCESLACGLPLVVAPIKDDQPVIATQVEAAGAGVRVKFGRVTAEGLRVAVRSVLDDPSYRTAARRIADSFEKAGGVQAAADALESLVEG